MHPAFRNVKVRTWYYSYNISVGQEELFEDIFDVFISFFISPINMVAKQTEQKTIYKTVDKNTQKHTRYTPDTKNVTYNRIVDIFTPV